MGKVGSIFRNARLNKGLTLEQVSDETNISKRYLQGIENDMFEDFPGEVYILGFMRNYADFLGLDAQKIAEIYRASDISVEMAKTEPEVPKEKQPLSEAVLPVMDEPLNAHPEENEHAAALPKPSSKSLSAESDIPSLFAENEAEKAESQQSATTGAKKRNVAHKKSAAIHKVTEEKTAAEKSQQPIVPRTEEKKQDHPQSKKAFRENLDGFGASSFHVGKILPLVFMGVVLIIAAISIFPLLNRNAKTSRSPSEYRAEGLPYEQRLYPFDKVYLPLGGDFIAITVISIKDNVEFDTPFGRLNIGLNEETIINPSSDGERLVVSIRDYAKSEPQHGALVQFDAKAALTQSDQPGDINIPYSAMTQDAAQKTGESRQSVATSEVLFKSPSGPHPFYVSVNFMAPVLFRYEADRKEWIEKYYRKGESITINASNSITFWTANAQAVKVNVFQSAGKSTELSMGGPGEISVKKVSWSSAQGGWAVVAAIVD